MVCVDAFRVEDIARLVVDIAISLNTSDDDDESGGEEEVAMSGTDDAQRSRHLQNENRALQMQLMHANREIAQLQLDLQRSARIEGDTGIGAVEETMHRGHGAPTRNKNTHQDHASTSGADRGRDSEKLDELYEREESLSLQLAELRHRLSCSQHDAVVEIKRRQKLENDWESEWAKRQRLERKILSLRGRYDAARGQFAKETRVQEEKLGQLSMVGRLPSMAFANMSRHIEHVGIATGILTNAYLMPSACLLRSICVAL